MSKMVASGIVKRYGEKEVLHGIDLELEQGKIYGLIGRNGAGKTTLLSILSSQNPATEGSVSVEFISACDGDQENRKRKDCTAKNSVAKDRTAKDSVAKNSAAKNGASGVKNDLQPAVVREPVWENPKALSHLCFSRELNTMVGNSANTMKVKEYLKIASLFLPHWDQKMADRLVAEFGLDTKKKISKLSKGMLSMVTIVVALASGAEFTFLDEPVAGLDVVAREKFYHLLLEEFAETGRTFVVSTHIIEEAADIFEEVIFLDEGKILLKENLEELLERAWCVSGREDEVDRATAGYTQHHVERLGRSKSVTILAPKLGDAEKNERAERLTDADTVEERGQAGGAPGFARGGADVTVQKVSLQKLFVALCGEEH
ncbi:MAG: ABC transporter ATP-binding protein [Clostridiales bacterium]|nr:ABC transporter ATP-binding protein [Clostridiales bacterium]